MQGIIRYVLAMALGGVVVVAAMLSAQVLAQEPDTVGQEAPMSVAGVAQTNHYVQYQGQVFNPNTQQPSANAMLTARFTLYRDAGGTSPVWQEQKTITTNIDGLFNTNLGDTVPFDLERNFDGQNLFLGVNINGEETRPLQPIGYSPYAIYARNADKLDGVGSHEFARVIAYGFIDDDGGKESGTGNFNSYRDTTDRGERVYIIDIDDVDYSFRDYTTLVTPACDRAIMVGTGSSAGDLIVDIFDAAGNRTKCNFQFAIFKRP